MNKKNILKSVLSCTMAFTLILTAAFMPSSGFPLFKVLSGTNITAYAETYDFSVNNVYYGITSSTEKTVSVNGSTGASIIIIPKTVTYDGVTYSVTSIAPNAFQNNSLTTINMLLATNITAIPQYAFKGASNLTNVYLPSSITSIGDYAFHSCYALSNITLPSALATIGSHAFYYCYSLSSIKIPTSVRYIGSMAFYNCSSLSSVDMIPTNRTIVENAFWGTSYYTNNYTTETYTLQNCGSAGICTGKQVVVSLFLDEKHMRFTENPYTYTYNWTDQSGVVHTVNNTFPKYVTPEGKTFYGPNVTEDGYLMHDSWNTTTDANGCVYSINDGNYARVSSTDISTQLGKLDTALTNIEQQATQYGKSVEFVSACDDPSLGMYFTYNAWNPNQWVADDNFLQRMTITNGSADPYHTMGCMYGNRQGLIECLYGGIYSSQALPSSKNSQTDCNAFEQIQNTTATNNYYSNVLGLSSMTYNGLNFFDDTNLTTALEQKYDADGVVYLIFTNNDYRSYARQLSSSGFNITDQTPEFAALCSGYSYGTSNSYMHEILHLYGASDYYQDSQNTYNSDAKAFADRFLSNEIMNTATNYISSITGYSIGWSNNILTYDKKLFFDDTDYLLGDINMDGTIDSSDMSLFASYCAGTQQLTYSQLIMFGYGTGATDRWSDSDHVVKSSTTVTFNEYSRNIGDVNFDGVINITDVNTLSSIISGSLPSLYLQSLVADVNNDGIVNSYDLQQLQQMI